MTRFRTNPSEHRLKREKRVPAFKPEFRRNRVKGLSILPQNEPSHVPFRRELPVRRASRVVGRSSGDRRSGGRTEKLRGKVSGFYTRSTPHTSRTDENSLCNGPTSTNLTRLLKEPRTVERLPSLLETRERVRIEA